MIAYIEGNIAYLSATDITIDVGGIGYSIAITLGDYAKLQHEKRAKLFITEIIREDAYLLYGFSTTEQRHFFEKLISVSGVGPATAQLILSQFTPNELASIISSGAVELLKTVKGIGLKTAQRIVVDLKGKINLAVEGDGAAPNEGFPAGVYEDAVSALKTLGYPDAPVKKIVKKLIQEDPAIDLSDIIRLSLKQL